MSLDTDKIFYKVKCPRDNKVHEMELRRAIQEDGSYFPSPPDGCNDCNGLESCYTCVQILFKLSQDDATMNSYPQPIDPMKYC